MGGGANRYQLVPVPPVELTCSDVATCAGKLTLTVKIPLKTGNKAKTKTETIGTATFSIPAGKTATIEVTLKAGAHGHDRDTSFSIPGDEAKTVKVNLDAAGRALLKADHGRCSASLALLELAPSPQNTQTKTVQLVRQKAHGKAKKGSRA